jgi:hypothetical protein
MVIVPLLVEPTFRTILALSAGLGLALAYTLKGHGSSFVAELVTVLENVCQPGDRIEVDGAYGEELNKNLTGAGSGDICYFGDYDPSKPVGSSDRIVAVSSLNH